MVPLRRHRVHINLLGSGGPQVNAPAYIDVSISLGSVRIFVRRRLPRRLFHKTRIWKFGGVI